jgi:hypothetical protein
MYCLVVLLLCNAQSDLEEITTTLRAFRESWTSIQVRNRQDLEDYARSYKATLFEDYVETALGQRMLETAFVAHNTGQPSRFTEYYDTKRFADVTDVLGAPYGFKVTSSFATEDRSMMRQCGIPLSYLYLMHRPLDTHLKKATDLGRARRMDRDCVRALITDVQWAYGPAVMLYDLDRETGFPLYVTCYASEADRAAGRPQWTWEALSFDEVEGGRRFPLKSVEHLFHDQGGKWTERTKREIQVMEVNFNRDYPASMFWPETRAKDTVWKEIAKVRWETPMAGVPRGPTGEALPMRADAPADWTAWLPWGALALSLMALCGGIALRLRQSRAA